MCSSGNAQAASKQTERSHIFYDVARTVYCSVLAIWALNNKMRYAVQNKMYLITISSSFFFFPISAERELPKLASNGSNYLYTTTYNYVDFNVDDNGIWVIYTAADSNNTIVAKVRLNLYTTVVGFFAAWIPVSSSRLNEKYCISNHCALTTGVEVIQNRCPS